MIDEAQEGVDHDTKRARASFCLVQTYNSGKKQQRSVVLLRALLPLWLYHADNRVLVRIVLTRHTYPICVGI